MLYMLFVLCSFTEKMNRYLLPCPFKYVTGFDCPGCGFQRACIALVQGNLQESFHLYPPAIPVLLTIVISASAKFWLKPAQSKRLINTLFLITGLMIIVSYSYKMFIPHLHSV